jgi:hypothetical protein
VAWIQLAQNRVQQWALENMIMSKPFIPGQYSTKWIKTQKIKKKLIMLKNEY